MAGGHFGSPTNMRAKLHANVNGIKLRYPISFKYNINIGIIKEKVSPS